MKKPIFTVGIPQSVPQNKVELIRNEIYKAIGNDYYVLIYFWSGQDFKFEGFCVKDFDEMKYKELKKILMNKFPISNNLN